MKKTKYSLIISLILSLAAAVKLPAQMKNDRAIDADSSMMKYTLENCVNHFSMDKTDKTDAGYQYWFIDKNFAEGKTLKLSVVKPHNATHEPHVHPEDEIFYILEGEAEVYLNGRWKAISSNTSFYCPLNVKHGIRNSGNTELKYLVIKKYEKK